MNINENIVDSVDITEYISIVFVLCILALSHRLPLPLEPTGANIRASGAFAKNEACVKSDQSILTLCCCWSFVHISWLTIIRLWYIYCLSDVYKYALSKETASCGSWYLSNSVAGGSIVKIRKIDWIFDAKRIYRIGWFMKHCVEWNADFLNAVHVEKCWVRWKKLQLVLFFGWGISIMYNFETKAII